MLITCDRVCVALNKLYAADKVETGRLEEKDALSDGGRDEGRGVGL